MGGFRSGWLSQPDVEFVDDVVDRVAPGVQRSGEQFLGLGYGLALWLGNIVIGWNVILAPYVLPLSDPINPLAAGLIIDHLVYGIGLGIAYAAVVPRLGTYRN